MANKLENVEEKRTKRKTTVGKTETENDPGDIVRKSDEPSKLRSDEIAVRGHICRGKLRRKSEEKGWMIAIEGIHEGVVIEAYPDILLVLTALRLVTDKWGEGV
ncbi:hypothetical protein CGRA01v4_12028 [Colletotrichum graminicola]|uniref:Uncharacterized protein n=1 Tax=Colletotrichum graminicola (strain M1.001 / M2 / FGSC 10212) TaxID=645133 RepID=E3QBN5_COLGM|nr:uncharacterized protein GLRG_03518 [Colletotrichum graminicola M1.001]EFQ28374.1 hypothetical protein GLRG_03518 [Colletotrichum graminicola M1.001]WDK20741.1 hypothetical protein CGRA01v4_12028 [Colletotrichum graminicola]